VLDRALEILDGEADGVAEAAEQAADYLAHKAPYLDYPTALAHGWPIATGVIESARRHLVKEQDGRHRSALGACWRTGRPEAPGTRRRPADEVRAQLEGSGVAHRQPGPKPRDSGPTGAVSIA
jgi:hypothetical protein